MSLVLLTITLDSVLSGLSKGIFNFRIYRKPSIDRYFLYIFLYLLLLTFDMFLYFTLTTRYLLILSCVPVFNRKLLSLSTVERSVFSLKAFSLDVYRFFLFQASLYFLNIYMEMKGDAPIRSMKIPSIEEIGDMTNFIVSLLVCLLISTLPDNGTWSRKQELRIVNFIARYYMTSSVSGGNVSPYRVKYLLHESKWKELSDPEILKYLSMDSFVRNLFLYTRGRIQNKIEVLSLLSGLMSLPYGLIISILFLHRRFFPSILPIMKDTQWYPIIFTKCISLYVVSGYSYLEILFTLTLTEILDESLPFLIFIFTSMKSKILSLLEDVKEKIIDIGCVITPYVPLALITSGNNLGGSLLLLPSTISWVYTWPLLLTFGSISSYSLLHMIYLVLPIWIYALLTLTEELVEIREEHF